MKSYKLSYSPDGGTWNFYEEGNIPKVRGFLYLTPCSSDYLEIYDGNLQFASKLVSCHTTSAWLHFCHKDVLLSVVAYYVAYVVFIDEYI